MNEHVEKERPALITLICILVLLGVAAALWNINSPFAKALGTTFQFYYAAVILIHLIALIGIWKMKKWGVILFAVIVVINAGVLWQVWHFNFVTLLIAVAVNAVFVIIGVYNFPKMD